MNKLIEQRRPEVKAEAAECFAKGWGWKRAAKTLGVPVTTLKAMVGRDGDLTELRAHREMFVAVARLARVEEVLEIVRFALSQVRGCEKASDALKWTITAKVANQMLDELLTRRDDTGDRAVNRALFRQVSDAWNEYLEQGQKAGHTVVELEQRAGNGEGGPACSAAG